MIDRTAKARLRRLMHWLEQFKPCFGHRAQVVSLRSYVHGLFNDSDRKSMQAMLARVTEPVSYQAFQHFITHAPWQADTVWRRLLAVLPERRGTFILDSTGIPKQGTQSVGVARQYCGALGKLANCQVAVTAALWTGVRAWMLGGLLYLPEAWLTPERRTAARIPAAVRFQEKWHQGLTLLRRARAAGLELTAVVADAEFGDVTAFRTALHRLRLPYAVGISSHLTVFRGRPSVVPPRARRGRGRPQTRPRVDARHRPVAVRTLMAQLPAAAWRRVTWRNGHNPKRTARCAAVRVTPAHHWRAGRLAPEVWLLGEQEPGPKARIKHYFVHLPPTTPVRALARLAHQRWAIEQQYHELKGELGLDHFEGRSYPGWAHHVVLTAVAHAYFQSERMRPTAGPPLTFPAIRAIIQEIFTGYLFAQRPQYLKWIQELRTVQLRI